ncbi:MAG: hypothetical protein ACRDYD_05895, partial [Acidimicrobiales bacterium]
MTEPASEADDRGPTVRPRHGGRGAILDRLSQVGNLVDERGRANAALRDATGYTGSGVAFAQLLAGMERSGLIEREVRGKRTYSVRLTPEGQMAQRRLERTLGRHPSATYQPAARGADGTGPSDQARHGAGLSSPATPPASPGGGPPSGPREPVAAEHTVAGSPMPGSPMPGSPLEGEGAALDYEELAATILRMAARSLG